MDAILSLFESIPEYFEYARGDWRHDEKICAQSRVMYEFGESEKHTSFHGNQEEVYNKFAKHNVKNEASLMNGFIDNLKTLDFDKVKWEYVTRLTEGDDVDVNRYLDGNERCWNGVRRKRRETKVVRIYAAFGGNCGRTPKELAVNGALAVTLCEILESCGVAAELWACNFDRGISYDGEKNILTMIKAKGANEFADLGMINYVIGDSHVFRNTCFRNWCKTLAHQGLDVAYNLGSCHDITKEMIDGYDDGTADGTILIPPIYDIDQAKRWLTDLVNNKLKLKQEGWDEK